MQGEYECPFGDRDPYASIKSLRSHIRQVNDKVPVARVARRAKEYVVIYRLFLLAAPLTNANNRSVEFFIYRGDGTEFLQIGVAAQNELDMLTRFGVRLLFLFIYLSRC